MFRMTTAIAMLPIVLLPPVVFAQDHSDLAIPPAGDAERAEVSQWIGLVKVTIGLLLTAYPRLERSVVPLAVDRGMS